MVLCIQCRPISDPVQTPQDTVSDQSVHCLLIEISMEYAIRVKVSTRNPLNYKWTHSNDMDKSNGQKRLTL